MLVDDLKKSMASLLDDRRPAFGMKCIDNMFLDTRATSLIVIGSRPLAGKTSLAIQTAMEALREKKRVVFFSFELSKHQVIQSMLSSISHIGVREILKDLHPEDMRYLAAAADEIASFCDKLDVFDCPLSVKDMMALCKQVSQEHNDENVDLIVIDSVQNIVLPDYDNQQAAWRNEELFDELSVRLKKLSQGGSTVIVTSSLSRFADYRHDKRPVLNDFAQWDGLVRNADTVILLYRDEVYNEESGDLGIAEISIPKNRRGETGKRSVRFFKNIRKFEEIKIDYYPNGIDLD